jgi:hypothetical protein
MTKLQMAENERDTQMLILANYARKIKPGMNEPEVDTYISKIQSRESDVLDTHYKIMSCCDPENAQAYRDGLIELTNQIDQMLCDLAELKAAFVKPEPKAEGRSNDTNSGHTNSHIKLPRLDPPKFDGDLNEWLSFKDLFTSAVHNNKTLSNVHKLDYLKTSLTGDAKKMLQSINSTDDNYDIAWALLESRYQNERELFFAILKRFVSQPVMTAESSTALRSILDTSKECIRALGNLKVPVGQWDGILVFLILQKLDLESKKAWELSLPHTNIPTLTELESFLEQRARALAVGGGKTQPKTEVKKITSHHVREKPTPRPCKICNDLHYHNQCPKLRQMSTTERKEAVRNANLCSNCLVSGHAQGNCLNARRCQTCGDKHHTLLHVSEEAATVMGNHMTTDLTQTMLATALIKIQDQYGELQVCRAMLDGGSSASFISESCVKRLGLRRSSVAAEVVGLGSTHVGTAQGIVTIILHPHFSNGNGINYSISTLIMKKVTDRLPVDEVDPKTWPHLQGLQLADPNYHKSTPVDILLGGDIFWDLLLGGKIVGSAGSPVGLCTSLGWLVAGNMSSTTNTVLVNYAEVSLEEQVEKFWDLESVPTTRTFTKEERECEDHFSSTTTRDDTGRFVVTLPLKEPASSLGSSREMAIRRLKSLEKRLEAIPEHKQDYKDFMHEYMKLGHMELVPEEEVLNPKNPTAYIPHHFVLKEESTTTKFRVVFDASAKTSSGKALNDVLMVGPTLQETVLSNLIKFRTHPIALTADVEKMYRQIIVKSSDTDLQRIVWREDPKAPIETYRLLTATYGTASAPYHATKALQVLAKENKEDLPLASVAAAQDFYVDDLMSGAPDVTTAIELKNQLLELTRRGGLHLRKWSSNSTEVLESLPPELRETKLPLTFDLDETVKTLGLRWNPATDEFSFKVQLSPAAEEHTKRNLLSEMAKIFDPLGWLAPTVVRAKILLQSLWKLELGWDDSLPTSIQEEWLTYRYNLSTIEQLRIPRVVLPVDAKHPQLLGFCDASQKAYSAVVYLRVKTSTGPLVSLISAKTRVAPTKQVSLPRLELCGALLLSDLMDTVQDSLKLKIEEVRAWTDSTVVLAWLKAHPSRWKTFAANRVTQITDSIPFSAWSHIKGEENPADCASRGIDPSELKSHSLWWKGPSWLMDDQLQPQLIPEPDRMEDVEREEKSVKVQVNRTSVSTSSLAHRCSSLKQLKIVTAYIKRWIWNHRAPAAKNQPKTGPLTPEELDEALLLWVKRAQNEEFAEELHQLTNGKPVSSKSKLKSLQPFLDSSQILKVGGRLRHSALSTGQKNPTLLPRHCRITELIIQEYHRNLFHGGAQLILSSLNRRFWIIGAKDAVRHQIKKCETSMHRCMLHIQGNSTIYIFRTFYVCRDA